jgi:hypothetical protein
MLLTELFSTTDQPSSVNLNQISGYRYSMDVDSKDGEQKYDIFFRPTHIKGLVDVNFYLIDGSTLRQDITGSGNQFSVFAGVLMAMRRFVASNPAVHGLSAYAAEPSRAKLYMRLMHKLSSQLNAGRPRKWVTASAPDGSIAMIKAQKLGQVLPQLQAEDPSWEAHH